MDHYFATANLLKSSVPEFLTLYSKHDGGEKQMIAYINKLLSSAKTRHRGLTILAESIPNLSADTFTEYGITWVKYCIVQHTEDTLKEVKLTVLVNLISHASSQHDFDKPFVSDHLSKTLEMCLESTSNHNEMTVALECLSICLNKYPNWFNPHTKKIENFLLKFLDHSSEDVVIHAAEAFHNLQQSGGGGLNKINYINNFTASFHKLCGNVNVLLNNLSADFTEIDSTTTMEVFNLMPIRSDEDSIDKHYRISQRLIDCVHFLKMMLKKPFSATKTIKPKILIDVIRNGMALHVCVSQPNVQHEDWHRSELLKRIQINLLYLLQMLLAWLKTNAFPYSYTISAMFVDSFLNCEKCRCYKVNNLYFKTLNRVFIEWIYIIKGIHPSFQMKIFSVLCNNITPITNKVSLILDAKLTGTKSKKFKRKAIEEKVVNSGKESVQQLTCQEQLILEHNAAAALDTLKSILGVTTGIKRDILFKIYKTTVGTALDIQAGRCNVPYHNVQCQVQLFKLLTAFLEQDDAGPLISIYPITRILSNGAKCSNKEISMTCEKGLRVIEKICQPVCPYITSTVHNISQENPCETIKNAEPIKNRDINIEVDEPLGGIKNKSDKADINIEVNEPVDRIKNKSDKAIKILSVETIVPPVIHKELSSDSHIIADEVPMQIDDDDDEPVLEVDTSPEADNDVEFVKVEVTISDDDEAPMESIFADEYKKSQEMVNDALLKDEDDIANQIINTVNQVVSDEVSEVVDGECEMITENGVDPIKTTCYGNEEDMLNAYAFVDEKYL